ncbi:S41 family peptidase [Pedobacter gandavensis]|uniref:S41 family peptidase n=1 Tax=Pedobacter gandavensis TaxID=2679963 RepID=UPI0029302A96|nr:S41 family peptidase [Pedobacter gandavensis]
MIKALDLHRKSSLFSYRNMLFLLILSFSLSCKKSSSIDYNENPDNFQKIFLQFWDKMNNQYVFWDKEQTDWDLVYKEYKPLFEKLGNSEADKQKAADYFKQMTANLIDNHYSITFNEGVLKGLVLNPAYDRKSKEKDFHQKYNYDAVVRSYLDEGYLTGKGEITESGIPINLTSGTINKNLLYFHCNFFGLKASYDSKGGKAKEILNYFFSQLKASSIPIKGIILDLRGNTGGNIVDLNFFAGKLVNQDRTFGYTRGKTGLGKLNYLPWQESKLKHDTDYQVQVPIILLADSFSASLSEIMMLALKSDQNLIIGEQTFGATGPISNAEIFNSGPFDIGSFLSVKTSAVEFKGIDGKFYENVGISPDIMVPFNLSNLAAGKDNQLELAIKTFQ